MQTPSTTVPLRVTLDPEGHPYDEYLPDDTQLVREHLVDLLLPSGRLAVSSGEVLQWLELDDPEASYLDLGRPGFHQVEVVWLEYGGDDDRRSPAGFVIEASGRPVARWGTFELAYGTDGGMGAVSNPEFHRLNGLRTIDQKESSPASDLMDGFLDREAPPLVIGDLDDSPGADTILFGNGFGDGGFPLARGYDESGDLAAIAIWHLLGPWRLGVPEGEPPSDVTLREEELRECLAGMREITEWGHCLPG